ncbi:protein WVD2-like 5 isoform X2 [Neltuma alba]|uniref:protein WVD2-like 5 isoform X2 n=1 Tax=Neltuma alba TaxID=207710 RepID=UPI0010A39238|nr:protein WVD2-like 5 isoform X2 [Prosopis alba]
MMDLSKLSPGGGLEAVHQNGLHEELAESGKHGVVSKDADPSVAEITETVAQNGNLGNHGLLDNTATDTSVAESKEESNDSTASNNVAITKLKITDQSEQLRTSKGPVNTKAVKPANPKGVHTSGLKKSKDRRDEEAKPSVLNGSLTLNPRQTIKGRSFNDRKTQISKHSEKSNAASSGSPTENEKPEALKKGTVDKVQGEAQSPSNSTAEDAKPPKVGMLPKYGFSFRCDERAERRKEFYSKLEEKIHAKEVEKSNLQAKTKETQEAEIKMLRKSLGFKATPMPSFYQEPPPKVGLKKIPTTRAKSPKLGRRKSSAGSELDGSPSSSARLGRLSLDEKVSKSNPTKKITHAHPKKPQRRSLPSKLPSDKTSSSTAVSSSKALNDEKITSSSTANKDTTLSNTGEKEKCQGDAANEENGALSCNTSESTSLNVDQNAALSDKPIETEPQVNGDIVVEEQPQLTLVQEPVAAEH